MITIYTILITNSNELNTSARERIMHRSKLVDNLQFLADPNYKGEDMSTFNTTLMYKLPISGERTSVNLILSPELCDGKLEYKIPFDTNLTKEVGDVELSITFSKISMDENGETIQQVRRISSTSISILPVANWIDFVPDSALSAIDQRLLMANAQIKALDELNQELYEKKADNLVLEEKVLQLTANGERIGDPVNLDASSGTENEDGNIRVVEF